MELFQKAVDLDPDYAPAWGRLARGYYYYGFFAALPPREAFTKLKEAAARALEKDPELAEAYGYRALAYLYYDWNWDAAGREFRRALELKPSHAELNHAYAHFLMVTGRTAEGVTSCERAVELDPVGVILTACLAWHCLFSRQIDHAIEPSLRALRLDPHLFWAHLILGWTYEQKSQFEQAIAEYNTAIANSGGAVITLASLAHVYAVAGRHTEAEQVLSQLFERAGQAYVSAYDLSTVYAGMNDADRTFTWLDKAYDERSSFLIHLPWDPRFDHLHADPRYTQLLRQVGLPS